MESEIDELKELTRQEKAIRARKRRIREQILAGEVPLKSARHVAKIEPRVVVRERTDTDVDLLLHLKANYV
jgi:hypothetical protein